MSTPRRKRVALLVNQVSPYRVKLYARLAERIDLTIFHGGMESNRSWKEGNVPGARDHKVAGWVLEFKKRVGRQVFDRRFLHIEPGYITELLRLRPDAIITSEIGFRTLVALFHGSIFRVPVWVWWGGTIHTERNTRLLRRMIRRVAAHWVTRWISYGQTSTEYLVSLGIPRRRILQIQNCVDEQIYLQPSKPTFDSKPKPVLLHAGQLIALKGVASLLRAAAHLQTEGLDFSMLMVGDGPDCAELKCLATQLGLRNATFYPAQPAEAMPAVYRSVDALIFPTLADVWGLVANEGILSGLPVLCSKYAGCAKELFEPECIFDPASEEDFKSALRRVIEGRLPPGDPSRLLPIAEVADKIAEAVLQSIEE